MSAFHIKGLDTLRAIAAVSVIIGHIELFKQNNGISNLMKMPFFKNTGGHIGVVLFFVLSGFLITVLLLKEKKKHNTISLKAFYVRRILRVWPLYYLIILLSYLLTDFSPSATTMALCFSIFPNIAHAIGAGWAVSPQIWSIGVEEQFYAFWPFVVKNGKRLLSKLILVFLFFTLLPHVILFFMVRFYPNPEVMNLVNKISYGTTFQCLAVGGVIGVIFSTPEYIQKIKLKKWFAWVLMILPFGLWYLGFSTQHFMDEIYAILFGLTILLLTTTVQSSISEFSVAKFLGKISYGLYMYHWLILILIFKFDFIPQENVILYNVMLYGISLSATIIVSTLSFYFIEMGFLNFKERFSRV
ncbi:acyltransferase family protein [Bacteroidota bacterium]